MISRLSAAAALLALAACSMKEGDTVSPMMNAPAATPGAAPSAPAKAAAIDTATFAMG